MGGGLASLVHTPQGRAFPSFEKLVMTVRTSKKTVTFRRPFSLAKIDKVLPAGACSVETDDELLEGLSFPAYRQVLTLLHLRPTRSHPALVQTLTVDPKELDAALMRDQMTE